ncbi:unnamed protein product [Leptidea sinapis]|uniref:SET domain-containing protein n=1 Tax=Leptidea sinapis TaxID=189913 RepID=A0A5E4Q2V6_9NEOP|nr:unnamed protein product [Leptidea sinapis]
MNRFNLRKKQRISYYEPDEPPFDDYVFCSSCRDYVYEYCAIHGPLLIIPDDKVPAVTNLPPIVPRAALTVPRVFLHLNVSTIRGAGLGVFATRTLPRNVRFGPYRGVRSTDAASNYCWQICDKDHKPSHMVDAVDGNNSNWMRFINCSRHWSEQNLVAFQYRGELYYCTIRTIPRNTELMVYYGSEFAHRLQVDIGRYNSPIDEFGNLYTYFRSLVHQSSLYFKT